MCKADWDIPQKTCRWYCREKWFYKIFAEGLLLKCATYFVSNNKKNVKNHHFNLHFLIKHHISDF